MAPSWTFFKGEGGNTWPHCLMVHTTCPCQHSFLPFSALPFFFPQHFSPSHILSYRGRLFSKNRPPTVHPDPHVLLEPCHSPIKTWSLYALPLNLGGPLWLPPLTQCGGSGSMRFPKLDHKMQCSFRLALLGYLFLESSHHAAKKAKPHEEAHLEENQPSAAESQHQLVHHRSESPESTSSSIRPWMWFQRLHTGTWTHKDLHVGFDVLGPVLNFLTILLLNLYSACGAWWDNGA